MTLFRKAWTLQCLSLAVLRAGNFPWLGQSNRSAFRKQFVTSYAYGIGLFFFKPKNTPLGYNLVLLTRFKPKDVKCV